MSILLILDEWWYLFSHRYSVYIERVVLNMFSHGYFADIEKMVVFVFT